MADAKQVAAELAEIENAPRVQVRTGTIGRCSFCGRLATNLQPVHDFNPGGQIIHERYKGECCRGGN